MGVRQWRNASAWVSKYTQPIGDDVYRYQEICLADEHGVIQLDQAPLWPKVHARLEGENATASPRVLLQHRSGSR